MFHLFGNTKSTQASPLGYEHMEGALRLELYSHVVFQRTIIADNVVATRGG